MKKEPSICPLCAGTGIQDTAIESSPPCRACFGRGIVWPPDGFYPTYPMKIRLDCVQGESCPDRRLH